MNLNEDVKNEGNGKINAIGKMYNTQIKLSYISDFLARDECEMLVELAVDKFASSRVVASTKYYVDDVVRSSMTYKYSNDIELIKNIRNRVASLVGKSVNCIEPLQIVKYEVGQFFKAHNDSLPRALVDKNGNQRQYTILVYLNDDVVGGTTEFPRLGLAFKPKVCDALFWENCPDMYHYYPNALHRGNPVKSGTKYALNIWINFKEIGEI